MSLLSLPQEILDNIMEWLNNKDSVNFLCTCSTIHERCQATLIRQKGLGLVWNDSSSCSRETEQCLKSLEENESYERIFGLNIVVKNNIPYIRANEEMVSKELLKMSRLEKLSITLGSVPLLERLLTALPSRLQSLRICLKQLELESNEGQVRIPKPIKGLKNLEICYNDCLPLRLFPSADHKAGKVSAGIGYMLDPDKIRQFRNAEVRWRQNDRAIAALGVILAQVIFVHHNSLKRIQVKGMDAYIIFRNNEAVISMPHLRVLEMYAESSSKLLWWFDRFESRNIRAGAVPKGTLLICNANYQDLKFEEDRYNTVMYRSHSFEPRRSHRLEWDVVHAGRKDDFVSRLLKK